MKNYNYVLIDWDGCLAKTLDIWLESYKQTLAEYDIHPSDRIITEELFGDWNSPSKVGIKNVNEFTKKLVSSVNNRYPSVELYEGVLEVIKKLKKRGKKLALITSTKRALIQDPLKKNGLDKAFNLILTAEDVTKHKPDREMIDKAIGFLKGSRQETVIVGDSKSDLGAAQNASIDSILYYPEHNKTFYDLETLKSNNPTYIIQEFDELLKIIK